MNRLLHLLGVLTATCVFAPAVSGQARISPRIGRDRSAVVIEFRRGTDARAMATLAGLTVRENPDLLPHQVMVRGTLAEIRRLAKAGDVESAYPASPELERGLPVRACAGAITMGRQSMTPHVGNGWGGVALRAATLRYTIQSYPAVLVPEAVRGEIVRAMDEWSKYVKVDFVESADPTATQTIAIRVAHGAHGDEYPFDGRGGTMAHTFYPNPPNVEPLAGDMHLDADEAWNIGTDTDLYSIVLHELGHALGLGHSDDPAAVMFPFYPVGHPYNQLTDEDVRSIRAVYARRGVIYSLPTLRGEER